jgi:hypothetical protein
MVANKMTSQPFYHLRPNKFIDRHLFVQVLIGLQKKYGIEKYQYIGFGSFMFDDFKVLHNRLGISDMISLEGEEAVYERADFNKPYECIKVENIRSSAFINDFSRRKNFIFWLDYTSSFELGEQFSEFCTLVGTKMDVGDIVRITLNANPGNLDDKDDKSAGEKKTQKQIHKMRVEKLREIISGYMPSQTSEKDMSAKKFPIFLLSCLKKAAVDSLTPSDYQKKYLFPLFSSVYADGQQMVILTAIVLDNTDDEGKIQECLNQYSDYVKFEWDKPCYIRIPDLTTKEIIHINSILPNSSSKTIKEKFGFAFQSAPKLNDAIKSYVDYYKYYPNFHHVNL